MEIQVQINQVLGLNKLQYINLVANQFNTWCEYLSNTYFVPMREFQTNPMLFNWFNKQWETRIVKPFLEENKGLIADGIKDTDTFFDLFTDILESPNGMVGIFPQPIVKSIKQQHYKSIQNK